MRRNWINVIIVGRMKPAERWGGRGLEEAVER